MNWKPILVGLVLIPINSLLILLARVSPTFAVSFYNVILFLFVLLVINGFCWAVRLQSALKPLELGLIYIMLFCSTALTCNHLLTELMPVIGYPFWYATAENDWKSLFFRYLPDWLTVNDLQILRGYYEGGSNFHRTAHLQAWLWPIVCWSTFLVVLVWSMLSAVNGRTRSG